MNLNKDRLDYLLRAYMEDTLTRDEFQELGNCILEADEELQAIIDEVWAEIDMNKPLPIASNLIYQRITNDPRVSIGSLQNNERVDSDQLIESNSAFSWKLLSGVAALLCIAFSLFLYFVSDRGVETDNQYTKVDTLSRIVPGGDKAMLTLADGRVIRLDEANTGDLANQFGVRIVKTADGSVFYETDPSIKSNDLSYNTIQTPNGGQYQLILPDGTKVWLNAASSLHYPTRFTGSQRVVELTGEAYFEVSSIPIKGGNKMPFIVKSNNQSIEVLGTHFNINNYDDVAKTTLMEGSVRISINTVTHEKATSRVLKPNQQSVVRSGSDQIRVSAIDPSNAIAWKNGYFAFEREKITEVMNTIARWYDIEVVYEGDVSNKVFAGTLSKFENFEKLLKAIELTGSVRFKIEGRRVIVMA